MADTSLTPDVGALTGAGVASAKLTPQTISPTVGALSGAGRTPSRAVAIETAADQHFSHLSSRRVGRYGHLVGFVKGRQLLTGISVNPPSIAGNGGTGFADVIVSGVKRTRRHRVVMLPPSTLEVGLHVTTTAIVGTDVVRVSFLNTTDAAINGATRLWSAHFFSMVP